MSSLHELIGTHALCSSRRQSRPTASSAHPRQGSVWSLSCAKLLGTFLLLGTHPGFLCPVSSWCCLLRPSSPAQHACPHAMLFGHFVHLFHNLIHSHLLICRSDLGDLHRTSSTDLLGQRCVFNMVHFSGTGGTEVGPSAMLCTERCLSLSHSAQLMAVSYGSQLESVIVGQHTSLQSVPQRTATNAIRQTLCHPASTITAHTPISARVVPFQAFENAFPAIPPCAECSSTFWTLLALFSASETFLHSPCDGELAENTK